LIYEVLGAKQYGLQVVGGKNVVSDHEDTFFTCTGLCTGLRWEG